MMFWQVCQCWNSIETKRLDSKKTHVKARIHPNPSVCTSIYWIRHVFVWRSQICHGTFEIYWCQRWKLGSPNLLLSTCAGHVRNGIVHHLVDKTTAHRGKFDFERKKQSKRLHRKDPLNLRCFEDDSMTDVRMRMCSSFLHEGGERIAKARIMYQDVSGCFTEVFFETMPQSRYSRPRDHNPAKAPSMNILWPCSECLLA